MRIKAREVVFEVIFASRFTGEIDHSLKTALYKKENLTNDDIDYAERVISAVSSHEEELGGIIDERSVAFPKSQLYPADLSILLIALAEIKYIDDVPAAVSANEAANIASKYSSMKSASFIGGILSDVIKG